MEYWKDGTVGFQRILSILNFIVRLNFAIYPIWQFPLRAVGSTGRRSKPIFPIFQYSTIPIGAQALTW
jgi:hypothetical protein